jgi:PST family polysaccharide transporter
MLLPFIAMPYIIGVCGVENFGRIIFVQTIIGYFTIVVNFGLNIFTVKEVANNLDNRQKISRITSTFIALRLLLVFLCFIVLCLLLAFIPFFQQLKLLLLFAFVASVAEIFNMTAFFQGMEKMHNIAMLQLIAVFFYIATLFIFVRSASSYELVPLLQALGLLIAALLGVATLYLKYKIKFVLPTIGDICSMAKASFPFAMSRVAITINANTAKFFAGLALGMHDLAVLDIVQIISEAAMLPVNIIDQAISDYENGLIGDDVMAYRAGW